MLGRTIFRSFTLSIGTVLLAFATFGFAHDGDGHQHPHPFAQLRSEWPTPNELRLGSGAPGPAYWQQEVDYDIEVALDEEGHQLDASARITYTNNSPHSLAYLWFQLDQNRFAENSHAKTSRMAPALDDKEGYRFKYLRSHVETEDFDGGYEIKSVTDKGGADLPHAIVDTMMRIDLPKPLESGEIFEFGIAWEYTIAPADVMRARSGYETFDDGTEVFEIAQWFPRAAAYTDYTGWQNKAFLGRGEFALEFGDYRVAITVPEDHTVAATGVLENPDDVLSAPQKKRLKQARDEFEDPVMITTLDEAKKAQSGEPDPAIGPKTWIFEAENVRDFAWASSRKFLWDALAVEVGAEEPVMAMSYWPPEGEPLWSQYSTHSVAHALEVYSDVTFPYPYPVCISVNGPVFGMEYPMITFNGARPEDDGTYPQSTKHALISVIIHEVGHIWFPMVINSDERQWTWLDEGLNTFVQTLAEDLWDDDYPHKARPHQMVEYMSQDDDVPIMTNSESIRYFGPNAYRKPAAALRSLRESVIGREQFDFAFREFCNRWAFKRPEPADFFRSMEDASGTDLDWFWRGWFYSPGHVDQAITGLTHYKIDDGDPHKAGDKAREEEAEERAIDLASQRNADVPKYTDDRPELHDFYHEHDPHAPDEKALEEFEKKLAKLEDWQREMLKDERHYYVIDLENIGTVPMPVVLTVTYKGGKEEELRLPAEIWAKDIKAHQTSRLVVTRRPIESLQLDPHHEIGDADESNNHWPRQTEEALIKLIPRKEDPNPIRDLKKKEEADAKKDQDGEE